MKRAVAIAWLVALVGAFVAGSIYVIGIEAFIASVVLIAVLHLFCVLTARAVKIAFRWE